MIRGILEQLVGLFVDDELLAAGILVAVAAVGLLVLLGVVPTWLAGLLLTVSLPIVLAGSVVRSAKRAKQGRTGK
jgi:hypothetical protein